MGKLNTTNIEIIPLIKRIRKRDYTYIFEDLKLAFEKSQLAEITRLWNEGFNIEKISRVQKRHELEILLALIYQADRNKVTRPFAYRIKE
ncbi:hypothetical protein [Amphibacillus xylanus]|uniref:Uncharacterized protein n=1 Tax=Amphibacillus xylanus (strain ATCC 51415 / DSM 6626 / JCM 7361 / LMG 17667 / NBRC 15112 / Ep01) TaxID=698758 RepID=K0IZC7_AMPXN|nr:hypothetical protein [Amphibacillus xylanus]BAM46327.1 hypothetical protein AXY_01950 [Amphibacillus xylanus NBRC 15112]